MEYVVHIWESLWTVHRMQGWRGQGDNERNHLRAIKCYYIAIPFIA